MYERILNGFTRSNFFQEVRRTPVREMCGLLIVANNHEMRLLIQYFEPIFNILQIESLSQLNLATNSMPNDNLLCLCPCCRWNNQCYTHYYIILMIMVYNGISWPQRA